MSFFLSSINTVLTILWPSFLLRKIELGCRIYLKLEIP